MARRTVLSNGYGLLYDGGRRALAHRVAWRLTVGELEPGQRVGHRCHRNACVNPRHLFAGTASQIQQNRWVPVEFDVGALC